MSKNEYNIVYKPRDADLIIFITCGASQFGSNSALKKIKEYQKYDSELIVGGCLPAIEEKKLNEIFNGKTIITKNLDQIDTLFKDNKIKFKEINEENIKYPNLNENNPLQVLKKNFLKIKFIKNVNFRLKEHILTNLFDEYSCFYNEFTARTNYFIKISQGCTGNCTYCGIKKAVGPLKSKSIDICVDEFKKGLRKKHKIFIITGDDVGTYGIDIKSSLPELLNEITKIPGDYKIRIRALHPRWVVKYINELEEMFKRKKITHVGIPIQSANSRILKLMNRYSDTEKMKDAIIRLKKAYPELIIDTHYLIGFPTETYNEFEETLKFIAEVELAGSIFPFTSRPNTPAESMYPKISKKEIIKRMRKAKPILKAEGYNIISLPRFFLFMFEKNKKY